MSDWHRGRPLAQDERLEPGAFLCRPPGERVYFGFRILDDVVVDGFTLGTITAFEAQADDDGDAFIVASDGEKVGLVWETTGNASVDPVPIIDLEPDRWGVWAVAFPYPMRNRDDARRNLAAILPELQPHWEEWRQRFRALEGDSD